GNSYSYRVRAMGVAGDSPFSNTATATTFVPTDPAGLSTATTTAVPNIHLTWTDASADESGFSIERCAGAGCEGNPANFAEIATVGANATQYDNGTGLSLNEFYSYRVRAFNEAGTSAGYTNVSTSNTFPPAAPSGLGATTLSANLIRLTWADNADNEEGYQVERCSGAGCSSFTPVASIGANASQFDDSPLSFNESYTYRVRAINAIDVSSYT